MEHGGNSGAGEGATIYVLKPGTWMAAAIDPGSGVVGQRLPSGPLVIYYEGNRYGTPALDDMEQRIKHAAGRLFTRYPTIAKMAVLDESSIEAVGRIGRDYSIDVFDKEKLDGWAATYRSASRPGRRPGP